MIKLTIIKYTNVNAPEATWTDKDDKQVHLTGVGPRLPKWLPWFDITEMQS